MVTVHADVRKPIPRFAGVFGEPEQQLEAPLGIENAVSGARGSFGNCHSGHGRLYRPQATLARPPRSGEPHHILTASQYLLFAGEPGCSAIP